MNKVWTYTNVKLPINKQMCNMLAKFPEQKVKKVPTGKWNNGGSLKNVKYVLYNIENINVNCKKSLKYIQN